MNIHYMDPWVLILNVTVIIILTLFILPTLLNTKEKIGVRLSFSMIFLIVALNCLANLAIFYTQDVRFFDFLFLQIFIPFLFGPSVYFYVVLNNGGKLKRPGIHFVVPFLALLYGIYHIQLDDLEKQRVFQEINASQNTPHNIVNTLIMSLPLGYFYLAKRYLKRVEILPSDAIASLKRIKIKWSHEFLNLLMFCVFSFLLIIIIATYYFAVPQPYLELIGMPLYFPLIYAIIAVRSNMTSKQLEMQYEISKAEEESRLRKERILISRDLHDNIGAYANSLIAKIDYLCAEKQTFKEEFQDLKHHAEEILALLRQTIWVLNTDAINIENFFDYVKQYTIKSFSNVGIQLRFEEDIAKNRVLNSDTSVNLFRIIQEGLQNIIKHSQASKVTLTIHSDDNICIHLVDNGVGFKNAAQGEGNGLENIRARSLQIGYTFTYSANKGGGSALILEEIRA